MDRSLDSALDSLLATINLDGSSSSDDDLVPIVIHRVGDSDSVELSGQTLLSADVTQALNKLTVQACS